MEKSKSILIIGGAGYVGSDLVPFLLQKGFKITVYDLMIYGENVLEKHKDLKIIKGDIRNEILLTKIIPGHDIVIHLACISNDPSFELNPKLGKSINLDSFEPIVKLSKSLGIERFIYASSSSVYGVKEEEHVSENMILEPLTDYSKFKAKCEKILLKYKSTNFVPVILRPATVCGYASRQRLDVVVNILTNVAFHKKQINVFGGDQLRPNLHIRDMSRAYLAIINADKSLVEGKIFNVGYENLKVREIAEKVSMVFGKKIKINELESNDKRSYHISSKKILNELNFKPNHTVEEAITELKNALEKNVLKNTLENEFYFNIKRMKNLKLN